MNAVWIPASLALTVAAYMASRKLAACWPSTLTTPVFVATVGVIAVLALAGIDYAPYRRSVEPLIALLQPATAALAIPLYKHRRVMAAYTLPALSGLVCGALATMFAGWLLAIAFGLPPLVVKSILIKSVTTPIAVELAPLIGGDPTLTAAFVVSSAMIGAMIGGWLLTRTRVHNPVSRGLAFGTIAHGIGTAQAATEGEIQGAVSGVAMGAAAVFVAAIAPWLVPLLMRSVHG